MGEIKIKNVTYNIHPIYDLYAADRDGNVININRKVPMKGKKKILVICDVWLEGMIKKSRKHIQSTGSYMSALSEIFQVIW